MHLKHHSDIIISKVQTQLKVVIYFRYTTGMWWFL